MQLSWRVVVRIYNTSERAEKIQYSDKLAFIEFTASYIPYVSLLGSLFSLKPLLSLISTLLSQLIIFHGLSTGTWTTSLQTFAPFGDFDFSLLPCLRLRLSLIRREIVLCC